MNRLILKSLFLIIVCVSFSAAQSPADLKQAMEKLHRRIRTVEQLAVRYQNEKAMELVKLAEKSYQDAVSFLQQGKYNLAKIAYYRSLRQVEFAARIVLYKPAARASQRLNELMRRAEQAVNLSDNEDARYMLSKARAFQMKAEQAFKREKYIESQQYYRVSTYFARKALNMVSVNQRVSPSTDFEQYYQNLTNLYKNMPKGEGSKEYKILLQKARDFMKKARGFYEENDTKQAFMYLQISERMLHRALDLSQDTALGRKVNLRENLNSLRRYLDGIEHALLDNGNKNAERLLEKANQYLNSAQRDFEKGDYQAAQKKTMLIQRMAAKALRYTMDTQLPPETRLKERYAEAKRLLQLRQQQIKDDDTNASGYLLQQADILLEEAKTAYDKGKGGEAYKKIQMALRFINQSKFLAEVHKRYQKDELRKHYERLAGTLTSLEEHENQKLKSVLPVLRRLLEKAKANIDSGNLAVAVQFLTIVENQIDFILKDAIK